jgi:hypothetical protein
MQIERQMDGQTDKPKLIVAFFFCNFSNVPKNGAHELSKQAENLRTQQTARDTNLLE